MNRTFYGLTLSALMTASAQGAALSSLNSPLTQPTAPAPKAAAPPVISVSPSAVSLTADALRISYSFNLNTRNVTFKFHMFDHMDERRHSCSEMIELDRALSDPQSGPRTAQQLAAGTITQFSDYTQNNDLPVHLDGPVTMNDETRQRIAATVIQIYTHMKLQAIHATAKLCRQ